MFIRNTVKNSEITVQCWRTEPVTTHAYIKTTRSKGSHKMQQHRTMTPRIGLDDVIFNFEIFKFIAYIW